MKQLILSIGLIIAASNMFAQNQVDALRYSQPTIGGTARSVGMGGAFGALGGDFSCLSQNPAGLGLYRSHELTFTPEFYTDYTTTRYFNNEVSESKSNFNISNFGYVATFKKDKSSLKSVNFGIGYNRIANFHKNSTIEGTNDYTSYADYMAGLASDAQYLDPFSTDLFYQAYLINPMDNGDYVIDSTTFIDGEGYFIPGTQNVTTKESGRINEWDISLGFNFNDIVYIGGSLGILPLRYYSEKHTREYDAVDKSYQLFDYYESLDVTGTGYTGKIGIIVRPIQLLRVGVAFHLPTSYLIHEEYNSNIKTPTRSYFPVDAFGEPLDYFENDYYITTPSKAILSAGLVLGKFMVVDGDMEFVNYSGMRLHDDDNDFSDVNETIKDIYQNTVNLKLGTELRTGNLYFRGGLGYYGSPYVSSEENADSYKLSYSCGFGVRNESFFFDVAYQYTSSDERLFLYQVTVGGTDYAPAANIDTKTSRLMTTIGFKF